VDGLQIAMNGAAQTGFARDPQMGNLWTKNLGALFAGGLVGEHTLSITSAGVLAPAAPLPGDASALDPDKVLDIVVYIEYRVTE
jgi:hypothetical protein